MKKLHLSFLIVVAGICYSQNVRALNDITILEILLPQENNTYITVKLNNDRGYYSYTFNNLDIGIFYNSRFSDLPDGPGRNRFIEIIKLAENLNNGIIEEIPKIIWHQNSRLSTFNGIKCFDTFAFSEHVFTDKQLTRILYLTTDNYYIRISIRLSYSSVQYEKLFEKIYEEVPQYFNLTSYESSFSVRGTIIWDKDGVIRFGNDLLTGQNNSTIANSWFLETEKFLNNIQFK